MALSAVGVKNVTVGQAVDKLTLADNKVVAEIPEVGPELYAAGKIASVAQSAGITEQKPAMAIPLPPITNQPEKITAGYGIQNSSLRNNHDTEILNRGITILNQDGSHTDPGAIAAAMSNIEEGLIHRGRDVSVSKDSVEHLENLNSQLNQYKNSVSDPNAKQQIASTQDSIQTKIGGLRKLLG